MLKVSCWISPLMAAGAAVAGTVIGATLSFRHASKLEEAKDKRLREIAWDTEQAAAIRQLQHELVSLKNALAPGREPKAARRLVPLDAVPSRNRALMLCTRLDNPNGEDIYKYLRDDAKELVEEWRQGCVLTWLPFNGKLQGFIEELGKAGKEYKPTDS